ncbi:MAG: class I SAM-dependent methyltransferase [Oscillospiraceae bacterium]
MISDRRFDGGRPFDWGRASEDYSKYRDIYPPEFYKKLISFGLFERGSDVLDIGTGTGVLPRALYHTGASFTGTDVSPEQIAQAKRLCAEKGMDISFAVGAAEERLFPDNSFDTITACQCYWYFDHEKAANALNAQLKPGGRLALIVMNWLPFEDEIAAESEKLVLKYNPSWNGCGFKRELITPPHEYSRFFTTELMVQFDLSVPFTGESWHGRMKACRGVGASLNAADYAAFDKEHYEMLKKYPESFNILHYAAVTILKSNKGETS